MYFFCYSCKREKRKPVHGVGLSEISTEAPTGNKSSSMFLTVSHGVAFSPSSSKLTFHSTTELCSASCQETDSPNLSPPQAYGDLRTRERVLPHSLHQRPVRRSHAREHTVEDGSYLAIPAPSDSCSSSSVIDFFVFLLFLSLCCSTKTGTCTCDRALWKKVISLTESQEPSFGSHSGSDLIGPWSSASGWALASLWHLWTSVSGPAQILPRI